jgi:hypothetical protein
MSAIDESVGQGQLLDTLAALIEQVRSTGDPDLVMALARLRRDAYQDLEHVAEPTAAASTPDDPFPGEEGLPEIAGDQLTTDVLGGALHHHGVLMVRRLIDTEVADHLADGVERAFEGQDRLNETQVLEPSPWFKPLESHTRYPLDPKAALGRQLQRFHRVLAVDSPRLMQDIFDAWTSVGLDQVLRTHFGGRPVLGENKFAVRRMPYKLLPTGSYWHQEASVFDVGRPLQAVNLWMALTPCGERAPAIAFIPAPMDHVVATDKAYVVAPERAESLTGGRSSVNPVFEPGDGVFFNERTFHRTNAVPSMNEIRKNVEAWFFAPWGHPGHNGRVVF